MGFLDCDDAADLKAAGYVVSQPDKDGDITFTGKILGRDFGGKAFMSPTAGLAKIVIGFPSGDDYKNAYQTVVRALTDKYGQGQEQRSFDPPYQDGDGSEETAILMGNARISTQWLGVASHTGLRVDITKIGTDMTDIIIRVSYESSLWPAEFARRARVF